ncbi:SGNH/GDSL hydrolase family protein [Streptomyces sp. NPDC057307]|uniref:SGNH/GDSL hydrolase family protein n=1 Tax=Streptomyces sp. NPDC057307 TaxID=3346096 RepID=UPI00363AEBFA
MRRNNARTPIMLALAGLIASLVTFVSPGTAEADTTPPLQWPAVASRAYEYAQTTTSPQGDVTVGCFLNGSADQDLTTYGATGTVTRQLNRTVQVDGVDNCILRPAVDKNGVVYGKPDGSSKLLAYQDNTLKWTYDTGCTSSSATPVVGADGNIYFVNSSQRLIGLAPDLASGQTTPTKVMDIAVKGSCNQGNLLFAYKDGIAAEWNYGGRLQYISYSGTNLGDTPTSTGYYQGGTPINAVGRLFYPTYVGSNPRSIKVSAYDPMTKSVAWTTSASTPGADMQQYKAYPLPGGGVLAVIKEQKMVADNLPATPTEYVTNLVTLNSNGQKVGSVKLPNKDTSGNVYQGNYYAVDTTGKVVVIRSLKQTLSYNPYSVPFTQIMVFDTASGAITYQGALQGNAGPNGIVYGYSVIESDDYSVIGPNTVYVNTKKCSGTCSGSTDYNLWPVKVQGLGMDYPRGAVLNGPKPESYVALGDSYSSGEGVQPFDAATNVAGGNQCHRSAYAYSRLVSQDTTLAATVGADGFVACSGAKTEHVSGEVSQYSNQEPQYKRLNVNTKYVTVSIGGNDIGFSTFGTACYDGDCDVTTSAYTTALGKINNELPAKLTATYAKILEKAPNAQIYVVGYPQVAPVKSAGEPNDLRCMYLFGSGYDWRDAQAARNIVTAINGKISTAVSSAGSTRLHYVDVNGANSPFAGHTVCSDPGDSYFFNIDQVANDRNYIFHPNDKGQAAYAQLVLAAMKG